jgi:4'-phosphopantetheinyl transferase
VRPQLNVVALTLDPCADDCLDESERARAARFIFERDRRRFISAHVQLRKILGHWLQRDAASLRFDFAARGKPSIEGLQFNLSHSGERALVAMHPSLPVGVDIEEMRAVEFAALAERNFSPSERADIAAAPDLRAAFFRIWTGKEAFIKLLGEGLHFPLDAFDIDERGTLAGCRLLDARRYSVRSLACAPGYAAAIAVEGPMQTVWRWQFREGRLVADGSGE